MGQRERLAIFLPSLREGGAERSMLKLSGGFAARGYPVDLVLAQREGPYLDEVPDGVRVVDLRAPRVLRALPALRRYMRNERPHALLGVMFHANMVALWARRLLRVSTRIVLSERVSVTARVAHSAKARTRLGPGLIRRCYPWADGIVAVSHALADDLARRGGIRRERIEVIYNPIVTPDLECRAKEPLEHPWFQPGQPPVVLGVGRLRPQKDFPTLLRAFARARDDHGARLMLLGDGGERAALESLVAELGLTDQVALPGFVANPYPYLRRASAFVLSSAWEGLPGALIEALYCGAPLVATDCPTGPREILRDGRYGRLVPVGDVDAMARGIADALHGRIARPPAESWRPFVLETVVDRYLELMLGRR